MSSRTKPRNRPSITRQRLSSRWEKESVLQGQGQELSPHSSTIKTIYQSSITKARDPSIKNKDSVLNGKKVSVLQGQGQGLSPHSSTTKTISQCSRTKTRDPSINNKDKDSVLNGEKNQFFKDKSKDKDLVLKDKDNISVF